MLRLIPPRPVATVWDGLLPPEVRVLPEDLARVDELLSDPLLLRPFETRWQDESGQGRPTIPMTTYLRLMVVKHRTGWGYETLVREVSDSLHLRRFCWIALHQRVPAGSTHENTLLPETVAELMSLGLAPNEAVFDAGFGRDVTAKALQPIGTRPFIVGAQNPGSRRSRRRLARYRVSSEGRISHLKREYGAGRSRLRGTEGARIWEGWAVLTYNLDTVARLPT